MFKKMDTTAFPPRQWALVGPPGCGKSTFSAQMRSPILPIDSDHRFSEVAHLANEVYRLSDNPQDNMDVEVIAQLLKDNMKGSGIKTIVVDSLTSIVTPLVVQAIMDNDSGKNKNRVSAFKGKALSVRLLQDAVTSWGTDVLWIYHTRTGLDGQARQVESTTISAVELARLRRSLNLQLKVIEQGDKRGIKVEWARCGRSDITLWDETGRWRGMPERIETAVYGGLTIEDMERIEDQTPTSFANPESAIAWGTEKGVFRDAVHAKNAYDKVKTERKPKTAADMWAYWIEDVTKRQQVSVEQPEEQTQKENE